MADAFWTCPGTVTLLHAWLLWPQRTNCPALRTPKPHRDTPKTRGLRKPLCVTDSTLRLDWSVTSAVTAAGTHCVPDSGFTPQSSSRRSYPRSGKTRPLPARPEGVQCPSEATRQQEPAGQRCRSAERSLHSCSGSAAGSDSDFCFFFTESQWMKSPGSRTRPCKSYPREVLYHWDTIILLLAHTVWITWQDKRNWSPVFIPVLRVQATATRPVNPTKPRYGIRQSTQTGQGSSCCRQWTRPAFQQQPLRIPWHPSDRPTGYSTPWILYLRWTWTGASSCWRRHVPKEIVW